MDELLIRYLLGLCAAALATLAVHLKLSSKTGLAVVVFIGAIVCWLIGLYVAATDVMGWLVGGAAFVLYVLLVYMVLSKRGKS